MREILILSNPKDKLIKLWDMSDDHVELVFCKEGTQKKTTGILE